MRVLYVRGERAPREEPGATVEREDERFDVTAVTGAGEGFDRLAGAEFDCVVADYDTPGGDGIAFLDAVRDEHPALPSVLCAGERSDVPPAAALSAGATEYVRTAPGSDWPAVLAHRVDAAVDRCRARETADDAGGLPDQLVEKTDDILFMYSGDWSELLFVNSAFEDVWGVPVEELEADPAAFIDYVHPQDREKARRSMDRIAAGEPGDVEYRVVRPDGDQRWVRGQTKPIFDDDGTIDRIAGYVRDITDRKEDERELQARNRQLQAVLDSVKATIWIRNLDNQFELVNRDFRDLFGFDDDTAIVGKRPSDLFPEDLAAQFRENDRRVIETGAAAEFQEEVTTGRGHRTYVTRITPLFDDDGDLFGTCGVASDITVQKDREQELERQNEQLDQFASTLRHELRNPLNILDGYLDVARETGSTEAFESCQTAVEQMQRLLEQTLVVLKRGETALDREPLELDAVCAACWGGMPEEAARVEVTSSRALVADEDRLKQLLWNLFRNAVEHGGPDVTVRVGDLEEGFYVEDDGPGIPMDVRETVFEEGYSTSEAGTGLGLAVVAAVAAAHGWEVRVIDGSTGGARFEVTRVERP